MQASVRKFPYTFGFNCHEIDLASNYGLTAIIQLLVLRYSKAIHGGTGILPVIDSPLSYCRCLREVEGNIAESKIKVA